MDDIAESQDLSKEISEAISNPVPFGTDVDEVRIIILTYIVIIRCLFVKLYNVFVNFAFHK